MGDFFLHKMCFVLFIQFYFNMDCSRVCMDTEDLEIVSMYPLFDIHEQVGNFLNRREQKSGIM